MEKHKTIPELRFPEFEGKWEEKKLGDIGSVQMCKRIFANQTEERGEVPFYKIGTLGSVPDAYISIELFNEYKSLYKYPQEGYTLITCSGTVGKCVQFDGHDSYFQDSNIVWIDNRDKNVLNDFLFLLLSNYKWGKLNSTTITRIYTSDLKLLKFRFSTLPEQQKIASFFTAIDLKISQLKHKKTLLEQYKKGVMQKIFYQEIRFRDDNGKEFPKWEKKRLGEIVELTMGQSPDSNSYNSEENGKWLIQGNADLLNRKSKPRNWTSEPTKECFYGDLIFTVRAPVGYVAKSIHNACIGRGVCSIRNNSNSNVEFLYQFLLNYELKWKRLEQGSTFTAVSGSDIKGVILNVPCLQEQTKIANFLSAIDDKINHTQTQIEKAEVWKKGLLQQMFV